MQSHIFPVIISNSFLCNTLYACYFSIFSCVTIALCMYQMKNLLFEIKFHAYVKIQAGPWACGGKKQNKLNLTCECVSQS